MAENNYFKLKKEMGITGIDIKNYLSLKKNKSAITV